MGSSSLKFQLLEMPSEQVVCEGLIERIGFEDSIVQVKYSGEKFKEVLAISDHLVGVNKVFDVLSTLNIQKKVTTQLPTEEKNNVK